METLLRLPDVLARTGLSRSVAYRLMSEGKFPKPIALSDRARAWPASIVQKWIEERVAEAA